MALYKLSLEFGQRLLWSGLVLTSLSSTAVLRFLKMPKAMVFMSTSTCTSRRCCNVGMLMKELNILTTKLLRIKKLKKALTQTMSGRLKLWLVLCCELNRTRPDLAHGVATMSRLMTKAPLKAIQIGTTLMKYVCGKPGVGLRYTTHVPDDWGAHGQLKVKRSDLLLEIFCDIAYSAGSGHRSVQGIVVCLGGQPICWQTSQQPFVTHSTAEAELVSYCEGLIAGKAAEALVMELTGVTAVMKVIYGDNIAAIGLANGTTSSSWRTRHLRIRASLLKQALDETDAAGGQWKLIHVRGLDADGFTKPLFGAAFQRFVENLGMNAPFLRPEDPEVRAAQVRSRNSQERVHAGAASAMGFLVGQTLLTEAAALELKSESDEADPLWIAAVLLMILGAIYAGKLTLMSAKCCLRRLQWVDEPQAVVSNDGDESSSFATKNVETRSSLRRRSGTSSGSGPAQALLTSSSSSGPVQASVVMHPNGTGTSSSYSPVQASSAGSMCSSGPEQALGAESSMSSVVFGPVQATRFTATGSITAERAGPVQATGASSSSSGPVQALPWCGADSFAAAAVSGPVQASSSSGADSFADVPGLEQALAAVAEISGHAAADGGFERALQQRAAEVSEALGVGAESKLNLHNPWNLFQHEHRGKGWSPAQMSKMYKKWRNHHKDKMPWAYLFRSFCPIQFNWLGAKIHFLLQCESCKHDWGSLSCQVRRMTRTNHSTEVYLYYRRHFGFGKQRRGSCQDSNTKNMKSFILDFKIWFYLSILFVGVAIVCKLFAWHNRR